MHFLADSYLRSLQLVVDIVKTMFKWIFLSLIIAPCCKYTYTAVIIMLTFSVLH